MSGTSLDGVDAVLADFSARSVVVSTHYVEMPGGLRSELSELGQSGADEFARGGVTGNKLTALYAGAVARLLEGLGRSFTRVAAIGCHGQTVRHRPDLGFTIQLVNGALLAEQTGIPVVCDFRSRDIAAGGEGAPLVPAFHAAMFGSPSISRAVVNLGGIANVTWLPAQGSVRGFDCGPGNALLDEWAERHLGRRYDAGGQWAAGGRVLAQLLDALMADPFFTRRAPKSTGREYFCLEWARAHLREDYAPRDVQATFAELTARVLAAAIEAECPVSEEVLLCGGGVANVDLVERIGRRLPGRTVASTARLGLDPDWVEALAFAWLARETLAGRPGNVPEVTGARGPRVLGCIYPA
jgi:anhydro-N-acetylmuramic acid kinase